MASLLRLFRQYLSNKRIGKYESEVRLGLLVIVLSLLMLNLVSNTLIFRAHELRRNQINKQMATIVRDITRSLPQYFASELSEEERLSLQKRYRLSRLTVVNSAPFDSSLESRKAWFKSLAPTLTPSQLTEIGRFVLGGNFGDVLRQEGDEYSYVAAVGVGPRKRLLILTQPYPDLAYLDSAQDTLFYIGLVGMFCIGFVYLLLSRFIVAPFRKLKNQAMKAGRLDKDVTDDAVELVEEYRRMITDLEQSKKQLVELNDQIRERADSLEEFNRQLLCSISSGLISLDTSGKVRSINAAGEAILDVTAKDAVDRTFYELFQGVAGITSAIVRCLRTGVDVDYFEEECADSSSGRIWLGLSISTVRNTNKETIGLSVFINDITELIHLRQELEKRHQLSALGEMSAGLAHQLRNSLGAISGYIKLIHRRLQKKDHQDDSIAALIQEVNEADELIGRFLQFARPLELESVNCDLQELIREVVESLTVRAEFEQIKFDLQGEIVDPIEADPLLLKQTLTNIIENAALSYKGNSGAVKLILTSDQSSVNCSIRDHGCGIPETDLQRIFTPFFSSRPSGSGLGLPLAEKIVHLHNGHLKVESVLGEGTCFTVSLPQKSLQSKTIDVVDQLPVSSNTSV